MLVQVNETVIRICSSGRHAVTSRGAKMLGMRFPLQKGWKRRMMGRCVDIPDDMIDAEQRPKLEQFRPGIIPTGGNWKPAHPGSPVMPPMVNPAPACRVCNGLRAAGIEVGFDVPDDVLTVNSLRSGKVTRLRGCDLNDEGGTATPIAPRDMMVPVAGDADGLRVAFEDGALTVTSERTGKVTRISVQALHGVARKAG